jgi:hypothetical protein
VRKDHDGRRRPAHHSQRYKCCSRPQPGDVQGLCAEVIKTAGQIRQPCPLQSHGHEPVTDPCDQLRALLNEFFRLLNSRDNDRRQGDHDGDEEHQIHEEDGHPPRGLEPQNPPTLHPPHDRRQPCAKNRRDEEQHKNVGDRAHKPDQYSCEDNDR